mgnify:CR=1 FL=1
MQQDERDNAILLYGTLKRIGAAASPRVGDFVQKTLAIEGLAARLAFVNISATKARPTSFPLCSSSNSANASRSPGP